MPLLRRTPFLAVALLAAAACSEGTAPALPAADRVLLTAALPDTIGIGDTLRLQARAYAGGVSVPDLRITWRSLEPAIASVDSLGLLTARVPGDGWVVVTAHARQPVVDTLRIRVRRLASRIEIGGLGDTLHVSWADTASAVVRDGAGAEIVRAVRWASSDTTIFTVDTLGRLTGRDAGVAWLRATSGRRTDSTLVRTDYRMVATPAAFTSFGIGSSQAWCGATATGAVWCSSAAGSSVRLPFQQVPGAVPLRDVQVGDAHRCGLAADSTMYCWGGNARGEFGLGTRTPSGASVPVQGLGARRLRQLAVGRRNTSCAITAADSTLLCWGGNMFLETGRGPAVTADTAVASPTGITKALHVSVADSHACAILLDRSLSCWGHGNGFGIPYTPTLPVQLERGPFTQVEAGINVTCMLDAAGSTYCNGTRDGLVFGRGIAGARFVRLLHGAGGEMCGLTVDGALWCWNTAQQLGATSVVPRAIIPGRRFVHMGWGFFASGTTRDNRCALSTESRLFCW